jgi:hypothetical protein
MRDCDGMSCRSRWATVFGDSQEGWRESTVVEVHGGPHRAAAIGYIATIRSRQP